MKKEYRKEGRHSRNEINKTAGEQHNVDSCASLDLRSFQSLIFQLTAEQVRASLEIRFVTKPITKSHIIVCTLSFPKYCILMSGERIRSFFFF